MACDEGPQGENPLKLSTAGMGPETRGLISALSRGFAAVLALVSRGIDTLVNLEVLRSPETFAFIRSSTGTDITPGAPEEVAANKSNVLIVVYVRAETYSPGIASHLILDVDANKCTLARARVVKHSVSPEAKVLLEPNQKLYADVTDSSGGVQATFRVTTSAIPLQGSTAVFKDR